MLLDPVTNPGGAISLKGITDSDKTIYNAKKSALESIFLAMEAGPEILGKTEITALLTSATKLGESKTTTLSIPNMDAAINALPPDLKRYVNIQGNLASIELQDPVVTALNPSIESMLSSQLKTAMLAKFEAPTDKSSQQFKALAALGWVLLTAAKSGKPVNTTALLSILKNLPAIGVNELISLTTSLELPDPKLDDIALNVRRAVLKYVSINAPLPAAVTKPAVVKTPEVKLLLEAYQALKVDTPASEDASSSRYIAEIIQGVKTDKDIGIFFDKTLGEYSAKKQSTVPYSRLFIEQMFRIAEADPSQSGVLTNILGIYKASIDSKFETQRSELVQDLKEGSFVFQGKNPKWTDGVIDSYKNSMRTIDESNKSLLATFEALGVTANAQLYADAELYIRSTVDPWKEFMPLLGNYHALLPMPIEEESLTIGQRSIQAKIATAINAKITASNTAIAEALENDLSSLGASGKSALAAMKSAVTWSDAVLALQNVDVPQNAASALKGSVTALNARTTELADQVLLKVNEGVAYNDNSLTTLKNSLDNLQIATSVFGKMEALISIPVKATSQQKEWIKTLNVAINAGNAQALIDVNLALNSEDQLYALSPYGEKVFAAAHNARILNDNNVALLPIWTETEPMIASQVQTYNEQVKAILALPTPVDMAKQFVSNNEFIRSASSVQQNLSTAYKNLLPLTSPDANVRSLNTLFNSYLVGDALQWKRTSIKTSEMLNASALKALLTVGSSTSTADLAQLITQLSTESKLPETEIANITLVRESLQLRSLTLPSQVLMSKVINQYNQALLVETVKAYDPLSKTMTVKYEGATKVPTVTYTEDAMKAFKLNALREVITENPDIDESNLRGLIDAIPLKSLPDVLRENLENLRLDSFPLLNPMYKEISQAFLRAAINADTPLDVEALTVNALTMLADDPLMTPAKMRHLISDPVIKLSESLQANIAAVAALAILNTSENPQLNAIAEQVNASLLKKALAYSGPDFAVELPSLALAAVNEAMAAENLSSLDMDTIFQQLPAEGPAAMMPLKNIVAHNAFSILKQYDIAEPVANDSETYRDAFKMFNELKNFDTVLINSLSNKGPNPGANPGDYLSLTSNLIKMAGVLPTIQKRTSGTSFFARFKQLVGRVLTRLLPNLTTTGKFNTNLSNALKTLSPAFREQGMLQKITFLQNQLTTFSKGEDPAFGLELQSSFDTLLTKALQGLIEPVALLNSVDILQKNVEFASERFKIKATEQGLSETQKSALERLNTEIAKAITGGNEMTVQNTAEMIESYNTLTNGRSVVEPQSRPIAPPKLPSDIDSISSTSIVSVQLGTTATTAPTLPPAAEGPLSEPQGWQPVNHDHYYDPDYDPEFK